MTQTIPDAKTDLAVLGERLGGIREQLAAIMSKLDTVEGRLAGFHDFKTLTERDLLDLRKSQQEIAGRHDALNRTVQGVSKAFDEYRDTQSLAQAKLHGQLVVFRWIAGLSGAVATSVAISWAMRFLGAS